MAEASRAGRLGGPAAARSLTVLLLAAIAAALWIEVGSAQTPAGAEPQAAGAAGGLVVVAGEVAKDSFGVYLVDPANGTMCVYQYVPGTRKLRLMASRNFRYDCQLDEYNTEPAPREIQKLVQQHRRLTEGGEEPK